MILDLGPMGQIDTAKPDSLAVAFEFTSLWAGENDSSVIARLCAGAIGVYIDKSARLPKYRPFTHKPLEYGHICLDRLLQANVLQYMRRVPNAWQIWPNKSRQNRR